MAIGNFELFLSVWLIDFLPVYELAAKAISRRVEQWGLDVSE
jgi:hypothetical protein